MMVLHAPSRIHLVRHATIDGRERLVGRTPGIPLNAEGEREATALALAMADVPLAGIVCSPQRRAQQTASALADPHVEDVHTAPEFDEVDFGVWAGRAFADLSADPAWRAFNTDRRYASAPGGESIGQVLARVAAGLARVSAQARGRPVAIVTHAEIVRCALIAAFNLSPNDWIRFDPPPASVTDLVVDARGRRSARIRHIDGTVIDALADTPAAMLSGSTSPT